MGQTISEYMIDDTVAGRIKMTLTNWNGVCYIIPHNDIGKCKDDLPEDLSKDLCMPGVYFLFGRDEGALKDFVYVGEADNVLKRLLQPHSFEKTSYWTEAVIFVTPDRTLDKAKVKYLESRFYSIMVEANRCFIKNANTPTKSPLPKSTQDSLETFIKHTTMLLYRTGYKALDVLKPTEEKDGWDDDLLYYTMKGGAAIGKVRSDGFWVIKGSYIKEKIADCVNPGVKEKRANCSKIIKNNILLENVQFGSPSSAASFVSGQSANGTRLWKNKSGIALKQIDEGITTSGNSTKKNE